MTKDKLHHALTSGRLSKTKILDLVAQLTDTPKLVGATLRGCLGRR